MAHRLALALVLLATFAPLASAHGDRGIAPSGTVLDLRAGSDAMLPFEGHYHRVVGVVAPAEGSAVIIDVKPAGAETLLWTSGRIDAARGLNALVPCCDDATWAPLRLIVRPAEPGAGARVALALEAVHDDFYVVGEGKEGDGPVTPVLFAIGGVLLARGGYRAWRPRTAAPGPLRAPLAWSASLTGAAAVVAVAAGSWGAATFGGTRIEGFLAAAGAISPWWGSVSGFVVLFALWAAALVLWMRAYRAAAAGAAKGGVVALGIAQAVLIAGLPFFFGAAYGRPTFAATAWCFWPTALVQALVIGRLALPQAKARGVSAG